MAVPPSQRNGHLLSSRERSRIRGWGDDGAGVVARSRRATGAAGGGGLSEAFATPEDARALKEISPGGAAEYAKGAAEAGSGVGGDRCGYCLRAADLAGRCGLGGRRWWRSCMGRIRRRFGRWWRQGFGFWGVCPVAAGNRREAGSALPQDITILPRSLHSVAGAPNNGAQKMRPLRSARQVGWPGRR